MSAEQHPLIAERNLLFGFALDVMTWAQRPTAAAKEAVVDAAWSTGPSTGVPDTFEQFARWVEQQPVIDEDGRR